MSFGFPVGDLIALSRLIWTLVDTLDSNTGSRAQYSRLSDELTSLHSALLAVQDVVRKLQRDEESHASTIKAITDEIECCQRLILEFAADTEKYRESLCQGGSGKKVKDAWRKICYKIFKEKNVVMLKDSLGRRTEAIKLLLLVAGIRSVLSLGNKVSDVELITRQQHLKIPKELGYGGIEGSIALQDALGRVFQVPLVFRAKSEELHRFLESSLRGLPSHHKVLSIEHSVSDRHSQDITSTEWAESITPAKLLSMNMFFHHTDNTPKVTDFKSECPSCKTPGAFTASRWTQCKLCKLWARYSEENPANAPIGVTEPRSPLPLPLPSGVSAISNNLSSFHPAEIAEVSQIRCLPATQPEHSELQNMGTGHNLGFGYLDVRGAGVGTWRSLVEVSRATSGYEVGRDVSECSVALGGQVIEDEIPDEQSMDR